VTGERERSFITYEQAATAVPERWEGPLPRARVVQIGVQRPLPPWVAAMRAAGSLVCGGVGWDATGAWSVRVLERLAQVDLFVPNAVEAMRYTRTGSLPAAVAALAERVPHVVVTDGPRGAIGVDASGGAPVRVAAPAVRAADPTGAGDVFTAAYLYGVLAGLPLQERLRLACRAAAHSVRSLGGARSAPHRADLGLLPDGRPDAAGADRDPTGADPARSTPLEQA
jgi:sugar/nucleoside kinase (ribokinase family)